MPAQKNHAADPDQTQVKRSRTRVASGAGPFAPLVELAAVERQHSARLSVLQEIIWETDRSGRLTFLNPPCTDLTHPSPEITLGSRWSDLFHPEDQPALESFLTELSERRLFLPRLQLRYRKTDGSFSWAELRARPFGSEGAFTGFQGTLVDILDRKQLEHALDLSESKFKAIFERAAIGILLLLPDGRTLAVNPAALRMLGRSDFELKARPFTELIDDEDKNRVQGEFVALLSGTKDAVRLESRFLRKIGGAVEADIQANVVRDEEGQTLFAIVLLKDVTEAKRTEEELINARKRAEEVANFKSTLLDNMSHELRTPLTTILGFASILAADAQEEQIEFIRMIQQAGERLTDTLNGMMDLAHLEAGELTPKLEPLHVQNEIQDIIIKMTPTAGEKALYLSLEGPPHPLYVMGDRNFLYRSLKHLISNGIKFTSSGGVKVIVEPDEHEVHLHVQDTGAGIGENFLATLFQEFRQESAGMARTHEGAGLGLSLTKRLAERMNGRISVQSRKGEGSTFTISLPRISS
jgi:PAS domain S-box-containing protein